MMKKSLVAIFMLTCIFSFPNHLISSSFDDEGQPTIEKLNEIQHTIESGEKDVLIIFDIDEVLLTKRDVFKRHECKEIFFRLAHIEISKVHIREKKQKFENLLSLYIYKPEHVLTEDDAPHFIKSIQNKGLKTIALTNSQVGKFGLIRKVENWKIDQLKKYAIDFSQTFPSIRHLKLKKIAKKKHRAPFFKEGILFSNGYTKGEVLEAFLKKIDWTPSKVIFVDDLAENLQSVKEHLDALEIPFVGFQYHASRIPLEKSNSCLIEFQIYYLLKNEEWINEQEAEELMK